jgi:hypothetical protein
MRRYWWVNHKQTVKQEIKGGYLWAPKVRKNGKSSHFYENMRRASPGDIVLSFANGWIKFVGTVTEFALSSPKPEAFGGAGGAWSDDGWRLPVSWINLANPVRPKSFINALGPLLRQRYAPMQSHSGNGNQAAYLAEIDLSALQLILANANVDLTQVLESSQLFETHADPVEELDEIVVQQVLASTALSETDKIQLIKARRGQGVFRSNVQRQENYCRVTGVTSSYLLVASHIKPWRSCANSEERLDGNNGLLLTPHVDLLFDRGYITFDDYGALMISSRIDTNDMVRLGIPMVSTLASPFRPDQKRYLSYHRDNVFVA